MLPLLQDYRYYDVFSAVMKISDVCNIGCSYCYRENSPKSDRPRYMPLEVIDSTLDSLLRYKIWLYDRYSWSRQPSIVFIWHGGEPLTVGLKGILRILDVQRKYVRAGLTISNCIQTNGTLLSEALLDILQREYFRIGISVDGPPEVHDRHRGYRNGLGSFKDTFTAIQAIKKRQYMWSAISVITAESVGYEKAIFQFFSEQNPLAVDFTPAFFYETGITLSPESYAEFMTNMFDLWASVPSPAFDIRLFKDMLYVLGQVKSPKTSLICELTGMCHRNISIMTNGDVYSCECLNSKLSNRIGNILMQTFTEIVHSEPFIRITQNTNRFPTECLKCSVFKVCRAGCYNRRLPDDSGNPRFDYYCKAREKIIQHVMKKAMTSSFIED